MDVNTHVKKWQNKLIVPWTEYLIIRFINERSIYGRMIINYLKDLEVDVKIPTVYAMIKRYEDHNLIQSYLSEEKAEITRGVPRKYYRITEEGKLYLVELEETIEKLMKIKKEMIAEVLKE